MNCPITNEECPEVVAPGMDKKPCQDCEIYKQAQIEALNEFMMSL